MLAVESRMNDRLMTKPARRDSRRVRGVFLVDVDALAVFRVRETKVPKEGTKVVWAVGNAKLLLKKMLNLL
jgi:hypothetical protein